MECETHVHFAPEPQGVTFLCCYGSILYACDVQMPLWLLCSLQNFKYYREFNLDQCLVECYVHTYIHTYVHDESCCHTIGK